MKVTITIEGEAEEIPAALRSMLALAEARASSTVPDGTDPEPVAASVEASAEALPEFWSQLRPEARKILARIAERPDGYAFEDLQANVGLDGLQVAGRLSSVGHVVKRFPGMRHPLKKDYSSRTYRMEPGTAEQIRRLAEDER